MQKIIVFQEKNSGMSKIAGIKRFGEDRFLIETVDIEGQLPYIIEDSTDYFPEQFNADLVLDYMKHPDLSCDLALLCQKKGIPVVATGKKKTSNHAFTPAICCMLKQHESLGDYGEFFGTPEIDLKLKNGYIERVDVIKGAPCGATWDAGKKIEGLLLEDAIIRFGLEVQFFCTADPASWDPITEKSPVHMAAYIHDAAFKRALKKSEQLITHCEP